MRVSDDIRRSNRAYRLRERLQDAGPQPRVKPRVMDSRDDATKRVSMHVDTERSIYGGSGPVAAGRDLHKPHVCEALVNPTIHVGLSWADCAYGDDCVCGVRDSAQQFFLHGKPLIGQQNFKN